MLRLEVGARGLTSLESSVLKDCRDRYKRAKQLGYENVEDRYSCHVTFCDRVHEDGRGLNDCIFDDMFAFANLPDPPRTRIQVSAGIATNAEHANCLSKLFYMSQPAGVDGFPVEYRGAWTKVWGFMFGRHILETEYVSYITLGAKIPIGRCLPGRALFRYLLTAPRISLRRSMRRTCHSCAGTWVERRSKALPQRPVLPKPILRSSARERPKRREMCPWELRPHPALRKQMPHPVPHHFFCLILQHQRAAQDHFWSQSPRWRRRHPAQVALKPHGGGIVIITVLAVSGAIGEGRGITEMRPAAVGFTGTVRWH